MIHLVATPAPFLCCHRIVPPLASSCGTSSTWPAAPPSQRAHRACPARNKRQQGSSRSNQLYPKASSDGDQETAGIDDHSNGQEESKLEIDGSNRIGGESGSDKDREEPLQIASGSPLPGIKPPGGTGRIPKSVLDILRDQVFGFDTFFVTGQEPYESGVLFTGNLRGDPSESYIKLNKRLQGKFGDQYKLFLLFNPEDDKPVAIVVPKKSLEPESAFVPEWLAASLFGLVSVVTVLVRNSLAVQIDFPSSLVNLQLLLGGLPGSFVIISTLIAHEAGHLYAAQNVGAELGIPYFIPSWQLGSFGGITRITNILPKRQDLLEVAAAGPLAGCSLAFLLLLVGFLLPPGEGEGIIVNATAFHDSLLVGVLAKTLLGDSLKEGASLSINPLVLSAWSGLLVNAINSIPVGEIDGGRISLALWGRKVWSRLNGLSIAILGFSALFSDVALYWVVLVLFLQRGPITPQSEEISPPDNKHVAAGIAVLFLGALVCFPFPFPFS